MKNLRDRAETEPKITRLSRGPGTWFDTEHIPRQRAAKAEPRPRQTKRCFEAASKQDSCLEDYITVC